MDEPITYNVQCNLCDTKTDVTVHEVDEKPIFCMMCGEQVEPDDVVQAE